MDYRKILEKNTFYCPDIINLIDKYIYTTDHKEKYVKVMKELKKETQYRNNSYYKTKWHEKWSNRNYQRKNDKCFRFLHDNKVNFIKGYKKYEIKSYEFGFPDKEKMEYGICEIRSDSEINNNMSLWYEVLGHIQYNTFKIDIEVTMWDKAKQNLTFYF